MPDVEELYTIRNICDLLGVRRSTVIRWIRSGRLLAFKLLDGRLWRIRKSHLLAFIEAGEKEYIEYPE
jgi:excisionase family DNA binding protein